MPRYFRFTVVLIEFCLAALSATAQTQGSSCAGDTGSVIATFDASGDTIVCSSGTWQYAAPQFGSTAASCSGSNAGAVQYTSGTLEACNGSSWIPIDSGMHFISTQTASASASLEFSGSSWSSSYNTLFLNCDGIVPATNAANLSLKLSSNNGTSYFGAAYHYTIRVTSSDGLSSTVDNTGGLLSLVTTAQNAAGDAASAKVWISNVGSSSLYKNITGIYANVDAAGGEAGGYVAGAYTGDTNTVNALKILFDSGNISSGTCSLYGMN